MASQYSIKFLLTAIIFSILLIQCCEGFGDVYASGATSNSASMPGFLKAFAEFFAWWPKNKQTEVEVTKNSDGSLVFKKEAHDVQEGPKHDQPEPGVQDDDSIENGAGTNGLLRSPFKNDPFEKILAAIKANVNPNKSIKTTNPTLAIEKEKNVICENAKNINQGLRAFKKRNWIEDKHFFAFSSELNNDKQTVFWTDSKLFDLAFKIESEIEEREKSKYKAEMSHKFLFWKRFAKLISEIAKIVYPVCKQRNIKKTQFEIKSFDILLRLYEDYVRASPFHIGKGWDLNAVFSKYMETVAKEVKFITEVKYMGDEKILREDFIKSAWDLPGYLLMADKWNIAHLEYILFGYNRDHFIPRSPIRTDFFEQMFRAMLLANATNANADDRVKHKKYMCIAFEEIEKLKFGDKNSNITDFIMYSAIKAGAELHVYPEEKEHFMIWDAIFDIFKKAKSICHETKDYNEKIEVKAFIKVYSIYVKLPIAVNLLYHEYLKSNTDQKYNSNTEFKDAFEMFVEIISIITENKKSNGHQSAVLHYLNLEDKVGSYWTEVYSRLTEIVSEIKDAIPGS